MSRRSRAACAALVLLWLAAGLTVASQTPAAATGRVLDRHGDPVPGAVVSVLDRGGNAVFRAVTDEAGRYATPELPAGTYVLEASLPGLAARVRVERVLAAGERVVLDLALDLDVVHASATVVAPAPERHLEARQLRESFARDAGEALTRVPGVERVRKGAIASDLVLRGFKGENVGVTVDGSRVHGACPNEMDPPAFHVDFAEIERIEVRKGPFEVRHQGALGGAVDIVTRRPDAGLHGSAHVATGSYGYLAPSVTGSYAGARSSVAAGYAARRQDPYEDGSGARFTETANYREDAQAFDVQTAWAAATFAPAPGHRLELQATRQRADGQLYPYLQMDAEYDDADRIRLTYDATAPFGGLQRLEASVSYAGVEHWMTDRLRVTSANRPRGYGMATLAETDVVEGRVAAGWGRLEVGLDGYRRGWDATNEMGGLNGAPYTLQAAIPDVRTDSAALYALYRTPLGRGWRLEAGARLDRVTTAADGAKANTDLYAAYHLTRSTSRRDTEPSANVLVAWAPGSRWTAFAGLGRTVRFPTAEERYFALKRMGSDWVGNPGLAPMANVEADVGLGYRGTVVVADVSVFAAAVSDYITLTNQRKQQAVPGVMNGAAKSYGNVDARLRGAEGHLRVAATSHLALSVGLAYARGEQDVDPSRGISSPVLPEVPPLRGQFAARYERDGWFGEVTVVAAARQDRVNPDLFEVETPGWSVAHVRGGIDLGRVSLIAGIDNVFDRQYRESLSFARDPFRSGTLVMEPGRSASLSLQVRY